MPFPISHVLEAAAKNRTLSLMIMRRVFYHRADAVGQVLFQDFQVSRFEITFHGSMTFGGMELDRKSFSRIAFGRMTLYKMTFCKVAYWRRAFCRMTLIRMTLIRIKLSRLIVYRMTSS